MEKGIQDILAKVTKQVPVTPLDVSTDVMIDMKAGGLDAYIDSLADALQIQYETQQPITLLSDGEGNSLSKSLELKEILKKYYATLLQYRVAYVRRELKQHFDYRIEDFALAITPYISALFEAIGVVEAPDKGVTLTPNIKYADVLSEKEMRRLSRRIGALLNTLGIHYVKELSRDRRGSIDVMTMQVIDGVVRNETRNESHTMYALMAATLNLKQVESVISTRVSYGDVRHLMRILPEVVDYESARV